MHYKALDPIQAIEDLKVKFPQYDFSKAVFTKSKEKITVICPIHGEFEIIYNNMKAKRSRGCSKCNGGVKYTQEEAIEKLKSLFPNYTFENFVYNGPHKPVTVTCPIHGDFTKIYSYISSGFGCTQCRDLHRTKSRNTDIMRVAEHIKMLEKQYPDLDFSKFQVTNKRVNSIVICKHHGEFTTNIENTRNATHICPYCSGMRNYEPIETLKKHNPELDFSKFKYTTSKRKSIVICPIHGEFKDSYFNIMICNKGIAYCPECFHHGTSTKEKDIYNTLKETFKDIEIINGDRSIIKNEHSGCSFELDIYMPSIKLAIEFNGTYWHSDESISRRIGFDKADDYHNYKLEKCNEQGIELHFIAEEEYDKDRDSVINKIINVVKTKISGQSKT